LLASIYESISDKANSGCRTVDSIRVDYKEFNEENLREKDYLGDLGIYGKIILNCIIHIDNVDVD
jgi:hypothetical protein